MGKFKEKIYRFMYGRYGIDKLYYFMLISLFVLMIVQMIVLAFIPEGLASAIVSIVFCVVTWSLIFFMIFRTMSRNIYKRRKENEAFIKGYRAVARFLKNNTSTKTKSHNIDSEDYIFRDCTKCGATLRLPRKVGKHQVKCPRCSHSFFVKSKK